MASRRTTMSTLFEWDHRLRFVAQWMCAIAGENRRSYSMCSIVGLKPVSFVFCPFFRSSVVCPIPYRHEGSRRTSGTIRTRATKTRRCWTISSRCTIHCGSQSVRLCSKAPTLRQSKPSHCFISFLQIAMMPNQNFRFYHSSGK